ncbi:MAG: family 10 glycosylhydrolase [Prevotella sp.]|nr:family 10 glycosylhydrolase [Prevotella sp.]
MRKWTKICFAALLALCVVSCEDDNKEVEKTTPRVQLPAKELRGVWMATVWGLDWPSSHDAAQQKQQYIDYLDLFAANNINAVFVQVRGMADAFYPSQYEPWSKTLTGVAGQDPGYDVLAFMIEEAHRRGIAFHAWMNPYRIATRAAKADKFPELPASIPQAWVNDYSTIRVYNPALPEVQQRIVDIVKDVVTKYDVDGIHFDDYFYPELTTDTIVDTTEYKLYGKDKYKYGGEFRRSNVDKVVKNVHDAIQAIRPDVVFSISPAANNETNYNKLYADVVKWSQEGWTEMIIPQLYFATGSASTSFNQRLHWWSQFTYNNALMVGYGIYKFGDAAQGTVYQTAADLQQQFDFAATRPKVKGSVLYSAKNLKENKVGIMDIIKQVYAHPALLPYLKKQPMVQPATPTDLQLSGNMLTWKSGTDVYYAVYRYNGEGQVATLAGITKEPRMQLTEKGTYFVTALNGKNHAESEVSDMIKY